YTSGSTGQPKGVLIAHQGLCNVTQAQSPTFRISSDSHILQFSSPAFDASVFEIFMALLVGAALYLSTSDALQAGPALSRFVHAHAITVVTLTPSVLRTLSPKELPLLHTIISAGEQCSTEIMARWTPTHQFFNAYGPTEATIWASIFTYQREAQGSIIGRPIANTQLYVLDQQLQPMPLGVPGELFIGGIGVARGYFHRPELTAERFIPHPFDSQAGARLYRTGDLVRYLPDGNVEFLGRLDQQVKLRGFRIELGEIEAALVQHPSVHEAVVVVHENATGDKRLVAYIVAEQSLVPSSQELRSYLQKRLPSYMLPATFVPLDLLPLTPNGKLDRHAVPVPEQTRALVEYVAPRTDLEKQLSQIWAQVLGLERVGIQENFFELGGHSLIATQMIIRVRERLLVNLPLRRLFEAPTVAQFASVIEEDTRLKNPTIPQ
ncbi:MAG: non-ribosomal peptide synthetase, partial [Ktedonobacteraceae bacterium]